MLLLSQPLALSFQRCDSSKLHSGGVASTSFWLHYIKFTLRTDIRDLDTCVTLRKHLAGLAKLLEAGKWESCGKLSRKNVYSIGTCNGQGRCCVRISSTVVQVLFTFLHKSHLTSIFCEKQALRK